MTDTGKYVHTGSEGEGYDLSTLGVIATLDCRGLTNIGVQIDGDVSISYEMEVAPTEDGPWFTASNETYTGSSGYDEGFIAAEGFIRIKNTTTGTAGDTADVYLFASQ